MASELHKKLHNSPIIFAILATVAILVGTVVTMFYPMMTDQMHPKLENLKPYTALQLAGRDVYQREGCNNCHTQTVRPLKTEVMRYGDYSKAGEFAYDHPFLWGSKRTGPDIARIGGKYPDVWHYRHFGNPQAFFAQSNMPRYDWIKSNKLDPAAAEAHMKALDFPYTAEEIAALKDKNELDALVAYMQAIGSAVTQKKMIAEAAPMPEKEQMTNPLAGDPKAIAEGKAIYNEQCASCHGRNGKGDIGPSLNLTDDIVFYEKGDISDAAYFKVISDGTTEGAVIEGHKAKGGMPGFKGTLDKNKIWSLVSYIRSIQVKK